MIDPKEALNARWAEYCKKSVPDNLYPDQKMALGDAYFHGMKGFSEMFHKMLSTEPIPTKEEIADFIECAVKPPPSGGGYKARR